MIDVVTAKKTANFLPIIKDLFYVFKQKEYDKRVSSIINSFICDLQVKLAEYVVVSSYKHTEFINLLCDGDLDRAKEKRDELDLLLNDGLVAVSAISCEYIKKYYNGRSKHNPRVVFKLPYNGFIIDLYRENGPHFEQFRLSDNTAFYSIEKNGKYYMCNDIPLHVYKGTYKNKRIDSELVKVNYPPSCLRRISSKIVNQRDEKWESCWDVGDKHRPTAESCYKSTIVIPMTLLKSTICNEFKKYMFSDFFKAASSSEQGNGKIIVGFLCMDHADVKYFNDHIDINIGYIIADILSLFVIYRAMYNTEHIVCKKILEQAAN